MSSSGSQSIIVDRQQKPLAAIRGAEEVGHQCFPRRQTKAESRRRDPKRNHTAAMRSDVQQRVIRIRRLDRVDDAIDPNRVTCHAIISTRIEHEVLTYAPTAADARPAGLKRAAEGRALHTSDRAVRGYCCASYRRRHNRSLNQAPSDRPCIRCRAAYKQLRGPFDRPECRRSPSRAKYLLGRQDHRRAALVGRFQNSNHYAVLEKATFCGPRREAAPKQILMVSADARLALSDRRFFGVTMLRSATAAGVAKMVSHMLQDSGRPRGT